MVDRSKQIELEKKTSTPTPIFSPVFSNYFEPSNTFSSSIHSAKKLSDQFQTSAKPLLDPPSIPIWKTIGHALQFEEHAKIHEAQREKEVENLFTEMQNFNVQEASQLEEASKIAKQVTFWGILEDVTASVSSSISLFLGFSTLSTGSAAVGGALVASGILSLANIAFKHARIWDWVAERVFDQNEELSKTISVYLPSAIGIFASAMGAYGIYQAWPYIHLSGTGQVLSMLQTTASLASGISGLGTGWSASQQKKIEAALAQLQSNADIVTFDMDSITNDLKRFYKHLLTAQELASRLTQAIEESIQITLQPV